MRERLYHDSAFDPSNGPDSHWLATAPAMRHAAPPLSGAQRCDVAVIGAGFTGLSAALRLAGEHRLDVRVVDAGEPAWGASGRNGGFCCFGGTKRSYADLARSFGAEETARFAAAQREAVAHVRDFLDRHGVDADVHSDGELCLAHRRSRIRDLRDDLEVTARIHGIEARLLDRDGLAAIGIRNRAFHAGLHVPVGFALHPLKYARGLADAAAEAGARLHGGSAVREWRHDGGRHRLRFDDGELLADRVLLATNGYGSERLPPWVAGKTLPAISSILVTRPLSDAERAAAGWQSDMMAFDTRHLLHYFRMLPDGRFLFGGRGGTDAGPQGLVRARRRLRRNFEAMFPAWREVETERFWSGFVCLTRDLVPYAGPVDGMPNGWAALAYHGNGVAMGSWTGTAMADVVAGRRRIDEAIPGPMRGPLRRFPLPSQRVNVLRAIYVGAGLHDAL